METIIMNDSKAIVKVAHSRDLGSEFTYSVNTRDGMYLRHLTANVIDKQHIIAAYCDSCDTDYLYLSPVWCRVILGKCWYCESEE
jgi:hypothetical protein